MSTKKHLGQIEIGNWYDSEKYYNPNPEGKGTMRRYFFTGDNVSASLHMLPSNEPPRGLHSHPHEQFLLVPQGDGKALVDDKSYDTEPGFFAYLPPNVPHGYDTEHCTYPCWNLDIFFPERLEYIEENFRKLQAQGKDPLKVMITKDSKEV